MPIPNMENSRTPTSAPHSRVRSHSGEHSHRPRDLKRHSRRGKQIRTLQITTLILSIALVVVFIGWINTWVNLNRAEEEAFTHASALRKQTMELETLRARDKELSEKLSAMVEERLPSLRPLKFDATIPIDEAYVRNISFTETGIGSHKRYEYSIVLANRHNDTLRPRVRILLFDEAGIQTGGAKITPAAATTNADLEFLEPREVRAYTSQVNIDRPDTTPKYFQIYIE